jgi:hypothetical protein
MSPRRATGTPRRGKIAVDYPDRRDGAAVRHMLDCVMVETLGRLPLLSPVALLVDIAEQGLARGQVGTIVETLDAATALVEFSDDEGRAYAAAPCPLASLLPLKTTPLGA